MSDPSELCIPADPDVSGIGVRIAIYAQNILTFIPAFYALWDGVVTHKELDSVRKHSTTILLTAFAILISAYVQASTNRLTNYHTIIVLNLSWMNNTNAFVYALLYIHHNGRSFLSWHAFYSRYIVSWSTFYHRYIRRVIHPSEWRTKDLIVFFLGSLHLSMMAILGIWFWSDRDTFGNFVACPTEPVISVIGVYVPFNSQALRAFSISLYSIVLTPILNLLLPMSLPCICYSLWHRKTSHVASRRSIAPIAICLFILLWLNILFAIDTELTLIHNRRLHGTGEGVWSFGQTLALLMLFPPLWDLGKSLWTGVKLDWEIKKLGKPEDAYKKAMLFERLDMIGDLAPKVNDPSVEGGRFGNALQLASHHGNLNLVKLLVDYGLNPNALVKSTSGTALQAAAARGNRKVVDYFVGKNVDVNALGGEFGTALQAAAFAGDAHSVMSLMSAGAHRNIKGGRYGTTLHAAVFSESELVVRLLVDSSEKISNVKEQRSPNADVIFFLPKRDNSVASSSRTNSLTTTCSSTLQDAPDFAAKDSDGNTALHLGVQRSSSNMVALLIKLGCNPDLRDRYLQTALHVGSKKGCTDIVRILLEGMAKADLKDKKLRTPLHRASAKGFVDIVQLLLEGEVDVNVQDNNSWTPLHWACVNNHPETVQLLLESKAKVDISDRKFRTPLHYASANGHEKVVKILLAGKVQIDSRDKNSSTSLHLACRHSRLDIVRLLLKEGAQVDLLDNEFQTPLHFAIESGSEAVIQLLIESGAELTSRDKSSRTPLDLARELEKTHLIELLEEILEN